MYKKILWYSILVVVAIGFVTLGSGFYKAMQVTSGRGVSATENKAGEQAQSANTSSVRVDSDTVKFLILGDSIARGAGDETGKGFAGSISDYIKNLTPKKVATENLGIDGQKSADLLARLQSGSYNVSIASSDFIVLSIGGNDLRTIQSLNDSLKEERFRNLEDSYLKNLKEIVKLIRNSNKNACLAVVGLYNPTDSSGSGVNDHLVTVWNTDSQKIIDDDIKAVFIPTYDLMKFNLKRYLSQDGLHPNAAGYQAIAGRVGKSIENVLN